ncbi:hypothetical protein [Mycobacteroides abscessus]|nr:hypothetical protein [Mycobacteroides abscessus]RIR12621.1 hypothetical protein D2E27_14960 [Mycobacteroides abscessus]RIS01592.1 hypothetical protein D2E58_12795 [Mycobacteroides abscessus]
MLTQQDAYLARIASRQGARGAYLTKARQGAEAIGRDALALKALGMSVSEIARRVNIPRPTLNEFISAAAALPSQSVAAPVTPLAVLSGSDLVNAVHVGGPIVEIAASFDDTDTLFLSGEPFARFVDPDWGSGMRIPNLMLNLEDSGWIGVDNATVGYGGTGPSNAHRALVSVGIEDDLASKIAFYNRVSHVRFDEDGNAKYLQSGSQWPRFGLSTPEAFGENLDRFRIKLLIADDLDGYDDDDSEFVDRNLVADGFYASPPDSLTLWERWLKYLDNPPVWLAGPQERCGTLFTSLEAADEAGFSDEPRSARGGSPIHIDIGSYSVSSTYQLIIEQGPIQLWLTAYTSTDPSVWVPPEFHDVLRDANLLPEEAIAADKASTLRKLVSRHRNRRPASIPLGTVGHATTPEAGL